MVDSAIHRIVSRISLTNRVPAVDYREYSLAPGPAPHNGPWIPHSDLGSRSSFPDFDLDLDLVDSDTLQAALEETNPWGEEIGGSIEGLHSIEGPGFPTILVGPNAGGKSVALKMIETFHQVVGLFWDRISELEEVGLPAIFSEGEGEGHWWQFTKSEERVLLNTLEQWDWLGPAWDLNLGFDEYSVDQEEWQVESFQPSPKDMPPLVTVGNSDQKVVKAGMEFRAADDCFQIRLNVEPGPGSPTFRRRPGYVMILIHRFTEENLTDDEHLDFQIFDREPMSEYEGIRVIEILQGTAYRLLSGVGDSFLPVTEPKSGVLAPPRPRFQKTMESNRISVTIDAIYRASEDAMDEDDWDIDTDDIFWDLDCPFLGGSDDNEEDDVSWRSFFDDDAEELDWSPIRNLNDKSEGGSGPPTVLRIDTLRRTSDSEVLLNPSQKAVADICKFLKDTWDETVDLLSTAKFYRLEDLLLLGVQDSVSKLTKDHITDEEEEDNPGKENFHPTGPYWFPALLGRMYDSDDFPPFTPSNSLVADLIHHTNPIPFHQREDKLPPWDDQTKLLVKELNKTELSELYTEISLWRDSGHELKNLADSYNTLYDTIGGHRLEELPFAHMLYSRRTPERGVFSAHLQSENGPENLDDALFSIINHTHNTLLRGLYDISHSLRSLSSRVSRYLGVEINLVPLIVDDIESMMEDPQKLDDIAEKMGVPYLSSGQAQLLTMLAQLELTSKENRIVLLDEPELSLHDKLISDLYEYICEYSRERNVQVICSTHSTTLAGLGLMYSVFVERKDDLDE